MIEKDEINTKLFRHVLDLNLMVDDANNRIAVIFRHADQKQVLEISLRSSTETADEKVRELPLSGFSVPEDLARVLHHSLGLILDEMKKEGR